MRKKYLNNIVRKIALGALMASLSVSIMACGKSDEKKDNETAVEKESDGTEDNTEDENGNTEDVTGKADEKVDMKGRKYESEITLGQYKGLKVSKEDVEVTEEDLNKAIDNFLWCFGQEIELKEGKTENGDVLTIDYSGKVDGKEMPGQSGKNINVMIGQNSFFTNFDAGITGKNIGDTVTFTIKVPEGDTYAEYAGKDIEYTVKIYSAKRLIKPELTDEFLEEKCKDIDTAAANIYPDNRDYFIDNEFMNYLGLNASQVKEKMTEFIKIQKILAKKSGELLDGCEMEYYRPEVSKMVIEAKKVYIDYCEENGLVISDYIQQNYNQTEEEFDRDIEDYVKENIKMWVLTTAIAEEERIEVTEEEFENYLADVLKITGKTEEELFKDSDKQSMVDVLISNKVMKWVAGQAIVE